MADHSTYTATIDIEAPPAVVFAHLVTAEGMLAWMGQHAELDPTPGGGFAVDVGGVPVRGHYLEVEPPSRVVVSWGVAGSDDFPPGCSRVEFTPPPPRPAPGSTSSTPDLRQPGPPATRRAGRGT